MTTDRPDRDATDDAAFARVPPQSLEAEQAVIGALLLAGNPSSPSYPYFTEILDTGITEADYYRPVHGIIHKAVMALHDAREPIDPITVGNRLTEDGNASHTGGSGYLHVCVNAVPSAANGPYYAEIVRGKAYRRAVIAAAEEILRYAYSEEGDEAAVRDLIEERFTDIVAGVPGMQQMPPTVGELYPDFVTDLEAIQDGRKVGLTYGLADLDKTTSGMQPGNVTVIAAQSGAGKTTLALNAATAAGKAGAKVMFASLEMSETELMQKIAAAEGTINLHWLTHKGRMTDAEWTKVTELGSGLFHDLSMRVYRPEGASVSDIVSAARACARGDGLDLLVVDYLQLIEVEHAAGVNREQAVASVSRSLKNLSVRLNCHVIALSQLNDSGLVRESRAIKNDASVVIKVERLTEESGRSGEVDLVVDKNRFGPTPTVAVSGQYHYSRFVPMAPDFDGPDA